MVESARIKEKTKEQIRKTELLKLRKTFAKIDENKKKLLTPLMEKAAFMSAELDELQKIIAVKGCTEEYKNGENQKGMKKTAEVEVYNTMIKNYTAIIKQLTDLVPAAPKTKGRLEMLRDE